MGNKCTTETIVRANSAENSASYTWYWDRSKDPWNTSEKVKNWEVYPQEASNKIEEAYSHNAFHYDYGKYLIVFDYKDNHHFQVNKADQAKKRPVKRVKNPIPVIIPPHDPFEDTDNLPFAFLDNFHSSNNQPVAHINNQSQANLLVSSVNSANSSSSIPVAQNPQQMLNPQQDYGPHVVPQVETIEQYEWFWDRTEDPWNSPPEEKVWALYPTEISKKIEEAYQKKFTHIEYGNYMIVFDYDHGSHVQVNKNNQNRQRKIMRKIQ